MKGHIKTNEESVTEKTKTKRKGLLRKQAVDFTWIGNDKKLSTYSENKMAEELARARSLP